MKSVQGTRERRRNRGRLVQALFVIFLIVCGVLLLLSVKNHFNNNMDNSNHNTETVESFRATLGKFAKDNNLQLEDWPKDYIERAEKNPELQDFVLNYPLKKDKKPKITLNELRNSESVPLLIQWDERWGYSEYAGNIMGFSGCGPTCLSMVSIYLLNDPKYNPKYIAEFSTSNGYSLKGNGSSWTLISEGGEKLGLDVKEIPLDENRIIRNLEAGNPIICVVGPGDFTTSGHFIVMTDYVDGKIKINDPNSKIRSEKLWEYKQIENQIKNLWVCRCAK